MNFRTHTMGSVTEEQFISIRDYVTLFFHSAMYIMSDAIPYPTTYVRRYNGWGGATEKGLVTRLP